MLKVIGALLSPWVRRVVVTLEEKGIAYEHDGFFPTGELPEDFKRKSPLGLVPVLETDEGPIADSEAIVQYLEARFPEVPLLPKEPYALARTTWFSAFAAAVFRHEGTLFYQLALRGHLMKQEPDMVAVEVARKAVPPLLRYLDGELSGKTYLVGDTFSLGDLTVASVLLNYLHTGERIDASEYPALRAFLDRVFARPTFARRIEADLSMLSGLSTASVPD
ncbi:MAG: glutathione S-transferase family protein [Myxococcota bacterium]